MNASVEGGRIPTSKGVSAIKMTTPEIHVIVLETLLFALLILSIAMAWTQLRKNVAVRARVTERKIASIVGVTSRGRRSRHGAIVR